MNMFRNLLSLFLVIFALALVFTDPSKWDWFTRFGPDAVNFLTICVEFKPFVVGACIVVALALFMTRKAY
jgi:hypothetical protein